MLLYSWNMSPYGWNVTSLIPRFHVGPGNEAITIQVCLQLEYVTVQLEYVSVYEMLLCSWNTVVYD